MRVHIEIDEDSFVRDIKRDAEVGLQIYFEHNNGYYPGDTWNDFGVRLLGFWLQQVIQLRKQGSGTVELTFLDGDFALIGQVDSNQIMELVPKNSKRPFSRLPVSEFEQAVLNAAEILLQAVARIGMRPRGIEGVEKGIHVLKRT